MTSIPLRAAVVAAALVSLSYTSTRAAPDWFSSPKAVRLRVEAPFNDLFAHAQQIGYAVRGSLVWSEGEGERRIDDAKITVRGHTSRRETECSFPKLKVTWHGGSVKIGTHCGDAESNTITPKYGRLPNQNSPIREAFIYRLLDTLGVLTLRAQPAHIDYIYTDSDTGRASVARNAFLLEDDAAARARLGASAEVAAEQFTDARDAFAPEDSARLAFAEALIGNFDWCLRFFKGDRYRCDARRPLWNILAFRWPDGTMRPLMYDFDVSGAVAGYHRWFAEIFSERFLPSRSHAAIEVIAQLQRARTLFDRPRLDATRRAFASRKSAAYRALAESAVDEHGKKTLREYFDAFFAAMESDATFYRPVVTAANTRAYADADRATPVCASVGALPVGTPVSEALETRGEMVRVVVLDALWKYAPPVKCSTIHREAVWIAKSAIGTDYP